MASVLHGKAFAAFPFKALVSQFCRAPSFNSFPGGVTLLFFLVVPSGLFACVRLYACMDECVITHVCMDMCVHVCMCE